MRKRIICSFTMILLVILLTACSQSNMKNNTYYQLARAIEKSVSHDQWDQAVTQMESFRIYYAQNNWRFEQTAKKEMTAIGEELNYLKSALGNRDKVQSGTHLSNIKKYTEEIFLRSQ